MFKHSGGEFTWLKNEPTNEKINEFRNIQVIRDVPLEVASHKVQERPQAWLMPEGGPPSSEPMSTRTS
jgi:hypothetical protein